MTRWVAAIVREGQETTLASELLSFTSDAYCPVYKRWRKLPRHIARKTGKSRELVVDALLPGYLFVQIQNDNQLAAAFAHKDVFDFVKTSTGVCYARASDIESLRDMERTKVHDETPAPALKVKQAMQERLALMTLADYQGKQVKLTAGPLQGRFGVVGGGDEATGELKLIVEGWDVTAKVAQVELA